MCNARLADGQFAKGFILHLPKCVYTVVIKKRKLLHCLILEDLLKNKVVILEIKQLYNYGNNRFYNRNKKVVVNMEDFVPYELAVKLKKKGFEDNCIGYYDYAGEFHYNYESAISNKEIYFCHSKYDNIWHRDLVDAPTISQVLKWLREEKKIFIDIRTSIDLNGKEHFSYYIIHNKVSIREGYTDFDWKFEQAALAGIEYVIDNLI